MTVKTRKKRLYVRNTYQNEELIREIGYLRSVSKDVVDRYYLRVQACLINIARILKSSNKRGSAVRKPTDKKMREMLSCARSLKVKPKKGRTKDLARIEVVVKKLDALMPSQP